MLLSFYKYQGTGNDFIVVDNIYSNNLELPLDPTTIRKLCQHKFGIGADGLIFLQRHPIHDFEMVYYNPDGSQSLCGNGSRCAIHLANELKIINNTTNFLAIDGTHQAYIEKDLIYLLLQDVEVIKIIADDFFVDTGSPHYIRVVGEVATMEVVTSGKAINSAYPFQNTKTNVSFVQLQENNQISMRTYERGVNEETLSCGTGAVAAALVASMKGYRSPIQIMTSGGKLAVSFCEENGSFTNIWLSGPAVQVFKGEIYI